jgi:single-strand DNA-binding protein
MLNNAQIIGHLGRDPEIRYLPNGDAVCNFSVATTEKWKDKSTGEAKEATEWHRINVFGRLAEICGEWLKKGSLVYVSGKIKTRKWTDKDGVEKYTTEISANEMKMLGGRQQDDDSDAERPSVQRQQAEPRRSAATPAPAPRRPATKPATNTGFDDMDDDIPF